MKKRPKNYSFVHVQGHAFGFDGKTEWVTLPLNPTYPSVDIVFQEKGEVFSFRSYDLSDFESVARAYTHFLKNRGLKSKPDVPKGRSGRKKKA